MKKKRKNTNSRRPEGRFCVGGVRCRLPEQHPAIRHMETRTDGLFHENEQNEDADPPPTAGEERRGAGELRLQERGEKSSSSVFLSSDVAVSMEAGRGGSPELL